MDTTRPLSLLGGLSAQQFMRAHWQKKPLLVRQAIPGLKPLLSRAQLFALASDDAVEARLLTRFDGCWRLRHGPFPRRALPPLKRPDWTLLVQGVDLHCNAAHDLLQRFRFVPDARLDDLMISFATDGGGVGPHVDSYDVFLLQAGGRRRWRMGRQSDLRLLPDLPVKVLARFEPEQEWLLGPGDLLYLPPLWAHEGVAVGACMTYSVGFRRPTRAGLAAELLLRLADAAQDLLPEQAYADPAQPAVCAPAAIPEGLRVFAQQALHAIMQDAAALDRALGECLSEPKPGVWFDRADDAGHGPVASVVLDRRTRMLHDARGVYINGESWTAAGDDARLMRQLADTRTLPAAALRQLSGPAQAMLWQWMQAGWMHGHDG